MNIRLALLDIGGSAVKYARWEDGALTARGSLPTEGARGAQDLLSRVAAAAAALGAVDALGVSARGQITREGAVYYDTEEIAGWMGTPVRAALEARLGVPVAVENDANCMALGEAAFGAARGADSVLCAAFGTSIGGGLVLGGELWRGAGGFAGEIGMMPFGGATWEARASVSALVAAAQVRDGRELCVRLDEPPVARAFATWCAEAADGLCALVHVLDPQAVVLGGGLMSDGRVSGALAEGLRARLAPGFAPRIVPAALGADAMLFGAAQAALRRLGR